MKKIVTMIALLGVSLACGQTLRWQNHGQSIDQQKWKNSQKENKRVQQKISTQGRSNVQRGLRSQTPGLGPRSPGLGPRSADLVAVSPAAISLCTSLGVRYERVRPEVAQRSDLPAGFYVTVKEVKPRSPAEKAGLQEFDIITHVDGHKIDHAKPLGQFIAAKDDGEQILIKFLRKGEEKEVTATLH